jgi:DNA-binding CsgD family transcriptional regulator
LARNFLDAHATASKPEARTECIERCIAVYRDRRDWDALFQLAETHQLSIELESLLSDGLNEMLDAARLATLERWVDYAQHHQPAFPAYRVARAELALRKGEHLAARTLALAAARAERLDIAYRALFVAAEAAHLAGDEREALELFEEAAERAPTADLARRAAWNRLMCLTELESEQAFSALQALSLGVQADDAHELVLEAGRRLGVELKFGSLKSLNRARIAAQLVPHVPDVLVRISFRSVLASALNTSSEYREALRVARDMTNDAEEHRLEFALPYAHTASAAAHTGLREFAAAQRSIDLAASQATAISNDHAFLNAEAQRVRILCQMGQAVEACRMQLPTEPAQHAALHAELQTSRALALVCVGRLEEAINTLDPIRGSSRCIEVRVLIPAIEAAVELKRRQSGGRRQIERLLDEAFESCGFDLLVAAYRSCPELLAVLAHDPDFRERIWPLLLRAGDTRLVTGAGIPHATSNPFVVLSKREKEISELVCGGLTNRQVAEILFLSETTVKAHLQHIFDKTGIRSRRALAIEASRIKLLQATPTANSGSSSDESNSSL